jgi:hypothetical protein
VINIRWLRRQFRKESWWAGLRIVGSLAGAALLACLFVAFPRNALYTIKASTQIASLTMGPDGEQICWPFGAGLATKGRSGANGFRMANSAVADFQIQYRRKRRNNGFILIVIQGKDNSSAGKWDDCNPSVDGTIAPNRVELTMSLDEEPYRVLYFKGFLTIGGAVEDFDPRPPKLTEGSVYVTTEAWPLPYAGRVETETHLLRGDTVTITGNDTDHRQLSAGFIEFGKDLPMRVISSSRASGAEVRRFGLKGEQLVAIPPTLFDRLRANSAWLLALPVGWLALRMLSAVKDFFVLRGGARRL